jgi:hypothetical protein
LQFRERLVNSDSGALRVFGKSKDFRAGEKRAAVRQRSERAARRRTASRLDSFPIGVYKP